MSAPLLETPRLQLRAITRGDAPRVAELAGDRLVAATTSQIPHPYQLSDAHQWIDRMPGAEEAGRLTWGILLRDPGELIGVLDLTSERYRPIALLGYWIGVPFWGNGYATEAAGAAIAYGFAALDLEEIQAIHMTRNPASGRVLQKLGMHRLGSSVEIVRGALVPIDRYSLKRADFGAPGAHNLDNGRAAP